jgi:ectoine hydroxylase-related dioxygenase (phytanoyl-CoA dioxygenase family)
VYCWALSTGSKAGESFTLPHRDYPFSEAFDGKGRPAIMNVWVPITDATLDNGCMYVVPKVRIPVVGVHFELTMRR